MQGGGNGRIQELQTDGHHPCGSTGHGEKCDFNVIEILVLHTHSPRVPNTPFGLTILSLLSLTSFLSVFTLVTYLRIFFSAFKTHSFFKFCMSVYVVLGGGFPYVVVHV